MKRDEERVIGVFGDSITWGYHAENGTSWSHLLAAHAYTEHGVTVFPLGIGGEIARETCSRIEQECAARNVNSIILAVGINDSRYHIIEGKIIFKMSEEEFRNDYTNLLSSALSITPNVTCIGLTSVDETKTLPRPAGSHSCYENARIQTFDAMVREVAEKNGVTYISLFAHTSLTDAPDGLHPTASEHVKIFERIYQGISLAASV